MSIDHQETIELCQEAAPASASESPSRLNATVAVTVAMLGTFLGICQIKDDNIVQSMQQAQTHAVDHWAFYQARNLRQEIAESTVAQLTLARPEEAGPRRESYDQAIERYRTLAAEQATKKAQVRAQAEAYQKTYDDLNFRDDQFDIAEALLAVAIAMLAVTALTQLWAMYWIAMVPTVLGTLMGLAGLAKWPIRPDAIVQLLT